jgi:hypothetical protein
MPKRPSARSLAVDLAQLGRLLWRHSECQFCSRILSSLVDGPKPIKLELVLEPYLPAVPFDVAAHVDIEVESCFFTLEEEDLEPPPEVIVKQAVADPLMHRH